MQNVFYYKMPWTAKLHIPIIYPVCPDAKKKLGLIVQERTKQEIAETLFISVNTVETHRASLLSKFGARSIAGLVREAKEKGLV